MSPTTEQIAILVKYKHFLGEMEGDLAAKMGILRHCIVVIRTV